MQSGGGEGGDKKSALFEDDETGRGGHSDIDIMIGLKRVPEKAANKPIRMYAPIHLAALHCTALLLPAPAPAQWTN